MSSGLPSSCRIRTASSSSRFISSFHGSTVHVAIAVSVRITGACPVISSVGMYPITELCVVRSAHSAYGSICRQSITLPSHDFASALMIGLCPRSIFSLTYELYAVSVNRTPCLAKNSLTLSESSSPRSTIICPTHPYLQNTSSKINWHTAEHIFLRSARPSTWFVRSS